MRSILTLFLTRLEGLQHHVLLVDELRRLGGVSVAASARRTRVGQAAVAAQSRLALHRDWEEIYLDGCILYLASQFELTAGDFAEALVNGLVASVKRYSDLPANMRETNLRLVGDLLTSVHRGTRTSHINHVDVLSDLVRCSTRGRPVALFSEGFSMHEHNLRADELAALYGRCDVKDFWRKVGQSPWLRAHLGTVTRDQTAELARRKLDGFIQHRNEIAHRGPNYQTQGASVVLDYIAFFRCLTGAVAAVLDAHVAEFTTTAKTARPRRRP